MEINIMDYVSKEEIKDEILSAFSRKIINMDETDLARVFSNGVYGSVRKVIDDAIIEKGIDLNLDKKIKEVAGEITKFNVFVDADRYNAKKSVAQVMLDEAVIKNKELLEEKVKSTFDKAYSEHEASLDIAQIMSDHVYQMFSKED